MFGLSRVVGIILVSYGALLALLPESNLLNFIGLASYYIGAYQTCILEPIDNEDGA
jgi:hypothetical protein